MNESLETSPRNDRLRKLGWVVSIIGAAVYAYGFFAEGSTSMVDWPLYLPDWSVAFVPNLEAEVGLALSIVGAIPLYYAEFTRR